MSSQVDAAAGRAADALEDERLAAIQCVAAIRAFSDRTVLRALELRR